MPEFKARVPKFLEEMMYLEGRGRGPEFECYTCRKADADLYRCNICVGEALFCQECIVVEHQLRPFDIIEVSYTHLLFTFILTQ